MIEPRIDQKMEHGAVSNLHSTSLADLAAGKAAKARAETVRRIMGRSAPRGVEIRAFTSAV